MTEYSERPEGAGRPDRAAPRPLRLRLDEVELERVRAHGGEGTILFRRLLEGDRAAGAWHFVDYAVVPPGASIGRHRHGANEELYLVLEGHGTMFRDGEEFEVGPGSVVLNRAFGEHGLRNDGEGPLRLFVVEVALREGGR